MNTFTSALKINPALWWLLKMNWAGAIRKLLRKLFTVDGALVAVVAMGFIYCATGSRGDFVNDFYIPLARYGSLGLFALFLCSMENGFSGRSVYFSNTEVQFLVTAPVTRQELLTYHILKQIQETLIVAAVLAFLVAPGFFPHVFIRLFVATLAARAFPLAVMSVSQRLPTEVRKALHQFLRAALAVILASGFSGVLFAVFWNREDKFMEFLNSDALHLVLFPFYRANELLFQPGALATLLWTFVIGGFAALCVWTALQRLELQDDQFRETREKVTQNVEKMKKQGFTLKRVNLFEVHLPSFPQMGGAGPILWRRCQELSRQLPYLLVLMILGAAYHAWCTSMLLKALIAARTQNIRLSDLNYQGQIFALAFAFVVGAFDFKSDTLRLEWLKSLPIHPSKIVAGQIAISSICVMAFICVQQLVNFALMDHYFSMRQVPSWYFKYLALSIPLGVLYSASVNAIFLLFPDYGTEKRAAIRLYQVLGGITVVVGMSITLHTVNFLCSVLTKGFGNNELVFFGVACSTFTILAALAFRVCVWAYNRLDVSSVSR